MPQLHSEEAGPASSRDRKGLPVRATDVRRRFEEADYVVDSASGEEGLSTPKVMERLGLVKERKGLERRLAEQTDLEVLTECPIIGVLGMLNAGKSALVQSFLGESGQGRIPVGIDPASGTQRFVFWLPEAWRQGSVRDQLEQLIKDNFGCQPDLLVDDPAEARRQYNDVSRFNVPLIAFDKGLDARQVAFLDCPDIEREMAGEGVEAETAEKAMVSREREALLTRAAELCSAFVLVAELRKVQTKFFREFLRLVREVIPGLPLFTALNQAPGDRPAAKWIADFADRFKELKLEGIYLAYDFHDGRTPEVLPEDVKEEWDSLKEGKKNPLVFFTEQNTPEAPRLLRDMPATRGPGEWVAQRILSGWDGFATACEGAEHAIEERNGEIEDRRQEVVEAVRQAVEAILIDEDGKVRMPVALSAELLGNAIQDTAPFYLRRLLIFRRKAGRTAKNIRLVYRAVIKRKSVAATKEEMEAAIKEELIKKHAIHVDDLVEALRGYVRGLDLDQSTLDIGARHAFERWKKRFETFTDTVEKTEVRKHMKEVWESMSHWQKARVTFFIGVFVFLSCIAWFTASIDGGLSLALVTSGTGSILGGALAVFSTKQFEQYLRRTLGQRTFSELTAYLLDAFGLPRGEMEGVKVSDEKIKIDFSKTDEVEEPVADLKLGRSYRRVAGRDGLADWIRARLNSRRLPHE